MKIAVYTCVVGGYDHIREPISLENEADYYMISDDSTLAGNAYRWMDIDEVVPDKDMSPKDKNRYCKLHPYLLFPEYDYTIYLDGSIQIVRPILHNVKKVGKTGIAIHRHRERDCIYSEGIFLVWLGAADKELLVQDISRYIDAGLPRHFGMFECGMVVTDIHNPMSVEIYENWYEEYMRSVKRDQQALIYTLWTMGLRADDVGDLGGGNNILTNPDISWDRSAHYK